MVTISGLIQIGILIVGIIGLVLQILEIDRNRRQQNKEVTASASRLAVTSL